MYINTLTLKWIIIIINSSKYTGLFEIKNTSYLLYIFDISWHRTLLIYSVLYPKRF